MIIIIEKLNSLNDVKIYSVEDKDFVTFGKILNIDVEELILKGMERDIPKEGNVYVHSDKKLEETNVFNNIKNEVYGGLEIQIGYCNGKNDTYNGFEYHKGSEVVVAITDFMLVLGNSWDLENNTYHVDMAKVFFVPKGTVLELYQTTLHLSPCKVNDDGFKSIIILPKGTNTELEKSEKVQTQTEEGKILLMKNKWIIVHKDREPLIKRGAYAGLLGENKKLKYK